MKSEREAAVRRAIEELFRERMAPPKPGGRRFTLDDDEGSDATSSQAASRADAELDMRQRLHVAACALLLELAWADENFTDDERLHIEAVMQRHFDLDQETAEALMELAEAERTQATDLYQFTSLIRQHYDLGQKTLLAEIMWGVILTDGRVQRHEGYMLRKIANLLDLEPGYLSFARKSVEGEGG